MDHVEDPSIPSSPSEDDKDDSLPSEEKDKSQPNNNDDDDDNNENIATEEEEEPKKKKKKKIHKLSLTETTNFNARLKKRGVVYLSRIPPRMGPAKVKTLLQDFGTVTRVYLEEEDKAKRKRRKKASGGSGSVGKRYVEGWVEFESKKVAKHVASSLNNTPISVQKRNVHFGDLWCLKYLNKFEWAHLTEKVAYERRMREQKLKIEMMQARKENQAFTTLVEAGKTMDKIEERRRKKRKAEGGDGVAPTGKSDKRENERQQPRRKFRQTAPVQQKKDRSTKAPVLNSLI